MTNLKDKEYLTVRDVAELLGYSTDSVYRMIKSGRLPAVRFSERKTIIKRSVLKQVLAPSSRYLLD